MKKGNIKLTFLFLICSILLTSCNTENLGNDISNTISENLIPNLYSTLAQIAATIILFVCIIFLGYKPAKKFLSKRKELLDKEVDETKKNAAEAKMKNLEADKNIVESKNKAKEIVNQAKIDANIQKEEILQSANEEASKRLKAIKEFTELGSGYKIAMRDLAIRGAGDILGGTQSGFIDSIGFDMYMKILQEAVNEKMGKVNEEKEIKSVNVNVDGYIPHDYVSSDIEKLELYQRLDQAKTIVAIDHLKSEFIDYYGKLPKEVAVLIEKRKLDILANSEIIEDIVEVKGKMQVTFTKQYSKELKGDQLFELVNRLFTRPGFKQSGGQVMLLLPKSDQWLERINQLISTLSAS